MVYGLKRKLSFLKNLKLSSCHKTVYEEQTYFMGIQTVSQKLDTCMILKLKHGLHEAFVLQLSKPLENKELTFDDYFPVDKEMKRGDISYIMSESISIVK